VRFCLHYRLTAPYFLASTCFRNMVDLKKNEIEIKEAWREVTNDNSSIDWALFGYEGQTNFLKLVSKGEDGIDELTEDLNPSKILYGFIRIMDPKTSLPKYVILNWQGDSAPGNRKGMCAMHLRDIERFLCGHHLTVNIRNEDDIDIEAITKKVSEITGSAYNFKEKPQGMEHSPEPVGTAHRKINPLQELPKMSEREKFWSKDQDEEKKRIVEERERRLAESERSETERKSREEKESMLREGQIKQREKAQLQRQQLERKSELDRSLKEQTLWQQQQEEDAHEARERSQRSEKMRQERNKEAQELIKNRSGEAKKLFTRNSSQGQLRLVRPNVKPAPPSSTQIEQNNPAIESSPTGDEKPMQFSVKDCSPPTTVTEFSDDQAHVKATGGGPSPENIAPPPGFQESEEIRSVSEEVDLHHATPVNSVNLDKDATLQSYGICAVSLYDYQASDETEISFDPGQIITHIDQIDPGWWQGLGPDGGYGLFPANYVEVIDNSELQIQT